MSSSEFSSYADFLPPVAHDVFNTGRVSMPVIGMEVDTVNSGFRSSRKRRDHFETALDIGFRRFTFYTHDTPSQKDFRETLDGYFGIESEDIFFTLVIGPDLVIDRDDAPNDREEAEVRKYFTSDKNIKADIERSLKALDLDSVDLLVVPDHFNDVVDPDDLPIELPKFWERMTKFVIEEEVAEYIGAQNFSLDELSYLSKAEFPPVYNTIPAEDAMPHAYAGRCDDIEGLVFEPVFRPLLNFCRENGIQLNTMRETEQNAAVQAKDVYSKTGVGAPFMNSEGETADVDDKNNITSTHWEISTSVMKLIARKHNKTEDQVVARWLIQHGVAITADASVSSHDLRKTVDILNFNIEQKDMRRLNQCGPGYDEESSEYSEVAYGYGGMVPPFMGYGGFGSMSWDGSFGGSWGYY